MKEQKNMDKEKVKITHIPDKNLNNDIMVGETMIGSTVM